VTSIAIALGPAPGAPLLAGEHVAATVAAAAQVGFGAVEVLLRHADDAREAGLDAALRDSGVQLRGVLSGPVRAVDGLSLGDPATAAAAVQRLEGLVELAAAHGAHVVLGWALGGADADPSTVVASLQRCRDAARSAGVRLLIEPVNRYEDPVVATAAAAAALIDRAGGGIELLLDVFHMNIEEPDPIATLRTFAARTAHVHLADSNRRLPGEGHLPLDGWLRALRDGGYGGTLGVEALVDGDVTTAARRAAAAMDALTHD
jgi:5-keto-L-gluconate epimerase